MRVNALLLVSGFVIASLLGGCAPPKPYDIAKQDRERFADRLAIVPPKDASKPPLILGVDGCVVYKAVTKDERIVDWKAVLDAASGASYPKFLSACTQQSIAYKAPWIVVDLCRQAIGAGGGCAGGGGRYRSKDGERWQ